MTQQVGITVGIPILSAIAATQAAELTGIHLALGGDIVITLASTALLASRLPSARHDPPPVAVGSRPEESADGHRGDSRELVDTDQTSP